MAKYQSPFKPVTSLDRQSYAHGLGENHDFAIVLGQVIAAEDGLEAGDIFVWQSDNYTTGASTYNCSLFFNDTDVTVQIGSVSEPITVLGTGGAASTISKSNARWSVFVQRTVIGDIPDITRVGLVPIESGTIADEGQYESPVLSNEYHSYVFRFSNLQGGNSVRLYTQFSVDGGDTYKSGANDYMYSSMSTHQSGVTMSADETNSFIALHLNG